MDKTLILNKLCECYKLHSKGELAKYLGVPVQNVSNWYARNTYDLATLILKFPEVSPFWLITGEGDMFAKAEGGNNIKNFADRISMSKTTLQAGVGNADLVAIAKKALDNQEAALAILNNLVADLIEKRSGGSSPSCSQTEKQF